MDELILANPPEVREEITFLTLPLPVLCEILKYCDKQTLGRLSQTCRALNSFINAENSVWIDRSKQCLVTNQLNESFRKKSFCVLSPKEKVRVERNWLYMRHDEGILWQTRNFQNRIMPWLQLERNRLYYSVYDVIEFAKRAAPGGFICKRNYCFIGGHTDDVSRFVCTDQYLISGGRDRRICVWNKSTQELISQTVAGGPGSEVTCVACYRNIVVSGSRNHEVKIWSSLRNLECKHIITLSDNIWDVTTMCDGRYLVVGSGSQNHTHPLLLYDLGTGAHVSSLGLEKLREGDGIYHIVPETPNEIYTGSYDSIIHLWDIRCPNTWVKKWDEPNDTAVYSLDSDRSFSFVSGTARHGLVRLWDKRASSTVRAFYLGTHRHLQHQVPHTPVYSVAFDAQILCAGLEDYISYCDFS